MDGAHVVELPFTPAVDRDIPARFLQQIADSEPSVRRIIIQHQAGFHLPEDDARLPADLRLFPLPPYCPGLNPVERSGRLLKAAVANRLYLTLRRLEDHLAAAARPWSTLAAVFLSHPHLPRRSGKLWRANLKCIRVCLQTSE